MADETVDEGALATRSQAAVATPSALPMSEIQLRIAREKPRDEFEIVERVKRELHEHPDFADEGFYSIPYKDKRKGVITFVEGLSIRAAEHIWTRWGNCTIGARIADDRGTKIMVQGMFFDYETGLLHLSDLEVSKMGQSRAGGVYPLPNDKLRLAVQSGESKVKRNAFLGGLPVWIKQGYIDDCRRLVIAQPKGKDKPVAERIAAAKQHFVTRYKVRIEDVDSFISKVASAQPGMTDTDLLRYLIGLNNAMKDGNVDVDFVFGEDREPASMPQEKKRKDLPNEKSTNPTKTTETNEEPTADVFGDAQEPVE